MAAAKLETGLSGPISVILRLSVFVTCALTMSTYTYASGLGGQTVISVTTKRLREKRESCPGGWLGKHLPNCSLAKNYMC